jgi:hypothetical protein
MKQTLVLLFLLSSPLLAQSARNEVSVSYGWIEVEGAMDPDVYGVSYNRYWTRFISTRVGAFGGTDTLPDDNGDASSSVAHATIEGHAWPGRLISPFGGVGVAYADHRNTYIGVPEKDAKLTPAFIAGIDLNLTPRFTLGGQILYSHYGLESRERFADDLTSIATMGSARFRW